MSKLQRAISASALSITIALAVPAVALALEDGPKPDDSASSVLSAEAGREGVTVAISADAPGPGTTPSGLVTSAETPVAGAATVAATTTDAAVEPTSSAEEATALAEDALSNVVGTSASHGAPVTPSGEGGEAVGPEVARSGAAAPAQCAPAAGEAAAGEAAAGEASSSAVGARGEVTTSELAAQSSDEERYAPDEVCDLYRLYNPYSGEHFYTASEYERDSLASIGWNDEGVGWKVPTKRGASVFRLYNPFAGDHHYTTSDVERDSLVGVGWNYEGVSWLSAAFGSLPVWRVYNPNAQVGTHHYTLSEYEYDSLVSVGWSGESVGFYAVDPEYVGSCGRTDFSQGVASLRAAVAAPDGLGAQVVQSTLKDETIYLFLPSYADASSVRLSAFDLGGSALALALSGDGASYRDVDPNVAVDVNSFGASRNSQGGLAFKCKEGMGASDFVHDLVVMLSANVSTVFVQSNDPAGAGRAFVEASPDHSVKAQVAVSVVDAGGAVVYDKDELGTENLSTIKGRGNSTWGIGDKKPYQITLSKKADLLQTGDSKNENKKWVLLANAADATLLHSSVAYDTALAMGMVGVESTPVDLYYDGEYRGSYLFVEKVEIKGGRVDIDDLEGRIKKANKGVELDDLPVRSAVNAYGKEFRYVEGVRDPEDISGGYLLEQDGAYYKGEKCWFATTQGYFVVKSPEVCSYNAMKYISEAVQAAIDNEQAGRFNRADSFSFDLDSLAKAVLINEYFKNIDAFFTSTYFYVDKGSKTLYCSPVWDFDTCMGLRIDGGGSSFSRYEEIAVPGSAWHNNAVVVNRLREIYRDVLAPLVKNVILGQEGATSGSLHSLTHYANRVSASQRMNEVLYGLSYFRNMARSFESWDTCVEYMRNWMGWRSAWFDANVAKGSGPFPTPKDCALDGFDYGSVYDYDYYLEENPDVAAAYHADPAAVLAHFVEFGMAEGRTASRSFNVRAYRDRYGDLQRAFGDDLRAYYRHYCTNGFFEGRICWR
ncbi:MAG: CotH kinase family protein [Olsenella sp.]|nr:CotH kinase family protein [Olsenella sp.]